MKGQSTKKPWTKSFVKTDMESNGAINEVQSFLCEHLELYVLSTHMSFHVVPEKHKELRKISRGKYRLTLFIFCSSSF